MSMNSKDLPLEKDRNLSTDKLSSLKSLRVLVVDDNEDNLLLTSVILEQYAVEVLTASSADGALKVLEQIKPDILILDIAMPGEDGYSLIRKIRMLKPEQGGQIPAIALTAFAKEEERMLCRDAGFQVHIAKPIEPDVLVRAVAALVITDR